MISTPYSVSKAIIRCEGYSYYNKTYLKNDRRSADELINDYIIKQQKHIADIRLREWYYKYKALTR